MIAGGNPASGLTFGRVGLRTDEMIDDDAIRFLLEDGDPAISLFLPVQAGQRDTRSAIDEDLLNEAAVPALRHGSRAVALLRY